MKIDGDSHSPTELVPSILEVFDSLAPGQSLSCSFPEPPTWLLVVLRTGRRGQFDWTPLGTAPDGYRIEISRRAAARGSLRGVSEALGWDHERLARLEVAAFVARAAGDAAQAAERYRAFSSGLRRHIAIEEQLLFALFEERVGGARTNVMRSEHRRIKRLLDEILRTIGDPAKLPDRARAMFHEILEDHHRKEEGVLYPALDEVLLREEADALVAKIQAFPAWGDSPRAA